MTATAPLPISIDDVHAAAARLDGVAHRTPLLRSRTLDARVGAPVALKAENLQRAGAFKFRGAFNAVAALRPDGVCTVSSGNHAQALALAAREHGARATILMPRDAPASKRAATEGYGAEVIEFDRYADDREALAARARRRARADARAPLRRAARDGRPGHRRPRARRRASTTSTRWSSRSAAAG